jgi:ribosome-associated protein
MMSSKELADLVVTALEDVKAENIQVIDVRDKTNITDYMIVASGRSNRQVRALAEHVVEAAKHASVRALGVEGQEQSEWVLVDLGDVVVHAMQPATRDFYQLEKLWGDIAEARKKVV